jgi:hypothetical protein
MICGAHEVGYVLPPKDQGLGIDAIVPIESEVRKWMGTVDLTTFIYSDEGPYTAEC